MTYLVTDNCINCKYTDCVSVCPVDCFYEGLNTLVINPDECIDCGVCEPECPAGAIIPDTDVVGAELKYWMNINTKYSEGAWPVITEQRDPMPDADANNRELNPDVPDKRDLLDETPGKGD